MPHLDLDDVKRLIQTEATALVSLPLLLGRADPPNDIGARGTAAAHLSEVSVHDPPESEKDIERVEVLAWDETTDVGFSVDGNCSLSANSKASGYTGWLPGNALLRHLQSMGTFFSKGDDVGAAYPSSTPSLENASNNVLIPRRNFCHPACNTGAVPKPKDGSWPLLSNIGLAVGAFSGPEASKAYDNQFYDQARIAFSTDLLQRGSVPLVQALLLMANYLQKRNKINSGFTLLGIACNMTVSMGTHREFSDKSINVFDMEIRRRIWWTSYIFDTGARLTLGRPSMLLLGVNIKPPSNLDDCDFAVEMTHLKASEPYPTTSSSLIWQCKLAEISSMANAKLLERRLPMKSDM
ncbi:fungal-specific transcription factor domain-containing protein [Astrocystis sublimbata]|nr:fungal-specific transcription factor domain-containing protein [Astrocystis sublimbata]